MSRLAAALPALLALGLYLRTLSFGLVWDDPKLLSWIAENLEQGGLPGLLLADFRLDPEEPLGYYRPVVLLSLWFDSLLAGRFPGIFHLSNTLLHAANAALVAVLLQLVSRSSRAALIGAAFFALSPVQCETAAFVSARTDLWAALFTLASAIFWELERRGARRRPGLLRASGLACFALALLSKEGAFLLPPVLLLWDVLRGPEGRAARGTWFQRQRFWLVGWSLTVAAVLVLRIAGAGVLFGVRTAGAPSGAAETLLLAARVLASSLKLLAVPWPLNAYYTAAETTLRLSTVAGALAALLVCAASSGRRHGRLGLLALVWVVGFLAPTMKLVPIGGAVVAERFLYLPAAGFGLALGAGFDTLSRRPRWAAASWALPLAVAGALSAGVLARQPVWRDQLSLFQDIVRTSPAHASGWFNLGNALRDSGRYEESLRAYERGARLDPRDADILNNMASVQLLAGRPAQALPSLREALRLKPGLADAWYNLGMALQETGRLTEAEPAYREALRLKPAFAPAYVGLGNLSARQGRRREAAGYYQEAIRRDRGQADAHYNLGLVQRELGDHQASLGALEAAIRLRPSWAEAHESLGRTLLAMGRGREARDAFTRALRLQPALAATHYERGLSYLRQGRRQESAAELVILQWLDPRLADSLKRQLDRP